MEGILGPSTNSSQNSGADRWNSAGYDGFESQHAYPYMPPTWNSRSTQVGIGTPVSFPTSNAGDLWSSFVPDYTTVDPGFSTTRPITKAAIDFSNSANIIGSYIEARRPPLNQRPQRPQFGRGISYPDGRLRMDASKVLVILADVKTERTCSQLLPAAMQPRLNESLAGIGSSSMISQPIPPVFAVPSNPPLPPSPPQSVSTGYDIPPTLIKQPSLRVWELPIRYGPSSGPIDNILLGLLQRQRYLALSGVTGPLLTGPYQPSLNALINPTNPESTQSGSIRPVSSILSDLHQRIPLRGLPEKVACLFVVYHRTQWQISPSPTTYNNIPEWHAPRPSQLLTPHPTWIANVSTFKLNPAKTLPERHLCYEKTI